MNISELSLKRPVLATVMNLMLILFGVVGYNFLAVRDYPAIAQSLMLAASAQFFGQPLAGAEDHAQQVVEVVGERAGRPVHGVEPFGRRGGAFVGGQGG